MEAHKLTADYLLIAKPDPPIMDAVAIIIEEVKLMCEGYIPKKEPYGNIYEKI